AAARRNRARDGHGSRRRARGRADRQPRHRAQRRDHEAAHAAERRTRPHDRDGDARGKRRRVRAARGRVPRRAHRERPAVAPRGGLMIWSTLLLAFRALRRNSLRSALTMLGIVIGVAAVIAIVTLGSGASARVSAGVSSLGDRLLFVNPGTNLGGPQRGVTVRQFTMRDVEAIERDVSGVEAVSPTANTPVTAVYGNNHWPVNVTGITKEYFPVRNATLVRGTEFNEGQYQSGRLVCIIGKTVRE